MARLSDWGERRLVDRLLKWVGTAAAADIGDDAAVLPMDGFHLLITTDVVNPATHIPSGATAEQVGWYLVAVNYSDLAAMGGEPLGFLSALSLPRHFDVEYVEGLARGMARCTTQYGGQILGGDTKEAQELSLAGIAVGRTRGDRVLRRTGCQPGDLVAVTGTLGGAGWAMQELHKRARSTEAMETLMTPHPRIAEGLLLAEHEGTSACMDISDGLGATLAQLSALNGCAFSVEYEALPADPHLEAAGGDRRKEAVLYHGGDFELLFTVRPSEWEPLAGALRRDGTGAARIGAVVEGETNQLMVEGQGEVLENRGYEHFT